MSSYGVMRVLHFQHPPFIQSKLVRCVKEAVLDVAVLIYKGSPTDSQYVAIELTEKPIVNSLLLVDLLMLFLF